MGKPMYQKIYDDLVTKIHNGQYSIGVNLPSEKELSNAYSVSRITTKRAFEMLTAQGYIKRIPGKGSFVTSTEPKSKTGGGKNYFKIGIVIDDISETFGLRILLAIESIAQQEQIYIIPRLAHGSIEREKKAIQSLIAFNVDGIILIPQHSEVINPEIMRLILNNTPIVMVDCLLNGIPAPFVGTDNIGSTITATNYLLDLGHRNISFLARKFITSSTLEKRIAGFIKSHAEHGVAIDESKWILNLESITYENSNQAAIRRDIDKIKQLIINNKNLTCFFASEYNIALLARAAVYELKMRVPEDISILCFDGPSDFVDGQFFTRIVQREEDIGNKAIKLMMQRLKHKESSINEKVFYDADLVLGKSTSKPRQYKKI